MKMKTQLAGLLRMLPISSLLLLFYCLSSVQSMGMKGLLPPNSNLTLSDDGHYIIFHTLAGDITMPIPDKYELDLKHGRVKRQIPAYSHGGGGGLYIRDVADYFSCVEQAQILSLNPTTPNFRNWEAFFKRNRINTTLAVRYCCNLLEYIDNAEQMLSPECREQVRITFWLFWNPGIRAHCREYEYENVQCFLVRWMWWWIPLLFIILIAIAVYYTCNCMRRNKNKSQL